MLVDASFCSLPDWPSVSHLRSLPWQARWCSWTGCCPSSRSATHECSSSHRCLRVASVSLLVCWQNQWPLLSESLALTRRSFPRRHLIDECSQMLVASDGLVSDSWHLPNPVLLHTTVTSRACCFYPCAAVLSPSECSSPPLAPHSPLQSPSLFPDDCLLT